jgi:hypothetical protein
MKIFTTHSYRRSARFIGGLLALFLFATGAFAQPPEPRRPGRFLFVFETTFGVQRTLPALENYLVTIFAGSLRGELHAGDEIGVWTLDSQVHAGRFPLVIWSPTNAAAFDRELKGFLEKQTFQKYGGLTPLAGWLNGVVENSERLTVLVFCDGQTGISGTPFDEGVRVMLNATVDRQKKARQPVVLVLRSQLGKYVGSAVTLPPDALNLPEFPPLPVKPAPVVVPVVKPAPVVKPVPVVVPSLIMVGTNLSTSLTPAKIAPEKPVAKPAPAPAPPVPAPAPLVLEKPVVPPAPTPEKIAPATNPVVVAVKTNPVVPPAAHISAPTKLTTRPVAAPATAEVKTVSPKIAPPEPPAPAKTAPATAAPAKPKPSLLLFIAIAAVGAVVVLAVMLIVRSRRPSGSLISSSMDLSKPPPEQK